MSLHYRKRVAFAAACALALAPSSAAPFASPALRVCSDPNNLPFSNEKQEGFENRIAELVARELGMTVEYTWWAQRRGFLRNTLNARKCDVVMGTPAHMEMLLPTRPYYRSSYAFVSRADRHLALHSFDDEALRSLKIGVQLVGDDYTNTPPSHALTKRGIVKNVVGFPLYGNYAQPNPPARIVEAVAHGDLDVAIVWGPLAGYVARHSAVPLSVAPITPPPDLSYLPFAFDISMGVRKSDRVLARRLDGVIVRRRATIDSILAAYGVPLVRPASEH
jgi:quinoprotein dehydrogenase-associated probable ABC transporter substrate-binding protein